MVDSVSVSCVVPMAVSPTSPPSGKPPPSTLLYHRMKLARALADTPVTVTTILLSRENAPVFALEPVTLSMPRTLSYSVAQ